MILICILVYVLLISVNKGNDVICKFYNLEADCRYRLDGFHMVIIQVNIDKCSDPVEVTFHIKHEQPYIDWSGTFFKSQETKTVEGFDVNVELQVFLAYDENKDLFVKAHFDVSNQLKAYFLHETVHLNTEDCIGLNKAGQIAVGCLLALLLIASILLVVLLYLRYKRKRIQRSSLVYADNIESPSPPSTEQPSVRFNVQTQQVNQNSTSVI